MILALLFAALAPASGPASLDDSPIRFSKDVAPILVAKCLGCHNDKKPQAGLNIATFAALRKGGKGRGGEIIVPGKPEASAIIDVVEPDADPRMPLKAAPLSDVEIATLKRWIKEGAKFDGSSEAETPLRALVNVTGGLTKVPLRSPVIEPTTAVEFAPDAKTAAAAVGRNVLLVEVGTGKTVATLADHPGPVTRLLFTADGKRLLAAGGRPGEFGSVRVWDLATRTPVREIQGHSDSILSADLSPDGSTLATGSYDRLVKLWDLEKGSEIRTLKEHTDAVYSVAFSPDGKTVASASGDRTVKLWDVSSGKKRLTLGDSTAELYAVAFGAGGKTIFAGGVDRNLRTWSLAGDSATLVSATAAHDAPIIRVAINGDRSLLATAGEDRSVKLWDASGGPSKLTIAPQSDWPTALALSADGLSVAVGRFDGSIDLFDTKTGARKQAVRGIGGASTEKPKLLGNATLNPITPRSIARGGKVRATLGGTGVGDTHELVLTDPKVVARIIPREKPDPNALDIEIVVAPDAPIGVRTLAARTSLGTTPAQPFLITAEPEVLEREPNDGSGTATPIALPATISGTIDRPGDVDAFRFHAEGAKDLTFDLAAKALGSPLNAKMRIETVDGRVIATSSDPDGRPVVRLAFRPDTTADYILRVEDQDLGGSGGHLYRIRAGSFARVDSAMHLAVQTGQSSAIPLEGVNLGAASKVVVTDAGGPAGRLVPLVPTTSDPVDTAGLPRVVVADGPQILETESDNESPDGATAIETPGGATGTIMREGDVDLYRFHARKGQPLIVETFAQRSGMPTDTAIEILDASGRPVPRAVLRPVEQTNVAFRDHTSMGKNIRLTQWDRFRENDHVLIGRELTRIDELPRNPDDDSIMWGTGFARSGAGERAALLDTTPEHHPLYQPIYKVEIHPPGTTFPPSSGISPVTLFFRNDDGGPEFGRDSRIMFDPPADGDYLVRVEDVRGMGGRGFRYHVCVREPRPDFRLRVSNPNPNIPRGGTATVQVDAIRIDGFSGPIDLQVTGLPSGITAEGSRIEADCTSAVIQFSADESASAFSPPTWQLQGVGITGTGGKLISSSLDPEGAHSGFVTVRPAPPLKVRTSANVVRIRPGQKVEMTVAVDRVEGFAGRVPIEVRNLPRGVRVLNIGLNGILVTPGQTERTIVIEAAPWVRTDAGRSFFAVATYEATGTEHSSPPIGLIVEPERKESTTHEAQAR